MGQQGCEGILSCEEFLHLVQLLLHLEDCMAGVKVYLDAKKKNHGFPRKMIYRQMVGFTSIYLYN